MAMILVVDDHPENRDLMTTILGYQGYQVLEANDGLAALSLIQSHKPDLIISDILMPAMDGFEFVRRLREQPGRGDIPVVFSTAHYLSAEARALAARCGVPHILPKPFEPEQLIRLTADLLSTIPGGGSTPPLAPPPPGDAFEAAHLKLLTDQLAEHNRALALANRQLEAEVAIRRQAEQRYRAVVDTAADAIVVIDDHGTIRSFNTAAERTFGYLPSEVIGENVSVLMPEPYRSRHDGFLDRYGKTGERRIIGIGREVEGRRKDGTTFPLDLAVAQWSEGGCRYFTGIMRDITPRKQAEAAVLAAKDQALQAKVEAEQANLAKSKFLAAVSHDLRQPAQAMVLFASLISQALRGHPQEECVRHFEHALSGLNNMLDVLLDVSRLDAGCVVARPTRVSLGDLILPLAAEYGLRANRQGLRLRTVRSSAWVVSDPALLERMLRNLIENALTYTPTGSVLIGCRRRGGHVRIDVVDTGIGIADSDRDQMFDEFFQVGNPERDRNKGLGLGLAIVKRLSQLLDHPVEVASHPGRGTRISILLPVAHPLSGTPAAEAGNDGGDARDRVILVVDDEPLIRAGLARILESWGFRVMLAESGAEAISLLESEGLEPHAVIADYRLRRSETGLDAIRLLADRIGRNVPGLVLTGDTAVEITDTVKQAGFPLVHKPITAGALHAAVSSLLP